MSVIRRGHVQFSLVHAHVVQVARHRDRSRGGVDVEAVVLASRHDAIADDVARIEIDRGKRDDFAADRCVTREVARAVDFLELRSVIVDISNLKEDYVENV